MPAACSAANLLPLPPRGCFAPAYAATEPLGSWAGSSGRSLAPSLPAGAHALPAALPDYARATRGGGLDGRPRLLWDSLLPLKVRHA